ncbi:c-type cytochrome [Aurantiacibacter odishensis]|uniref:c-type cytochrome n=1 Tax=Aurantiacibacter odishensis TaxID=1155476 RepID=UPI001F0CA9A8|nr:c-type cytochrome [Aurantiacibacter odishensis]
MRIQIAFATSTALALALSACGGPPESDDAGDTAAAEEEVEVDLPETMPEGDAETVDGADVEGEADAEDTEEPEPVASASPTPTPTATRTPAATPTQAMAAAKPQSFTTCGVCHSVEPGQNMIGPSLAGVVGRRAGSVAGANYSPAMQSANITWNEANLRRYIVDPNAVVPGGSMPAPGVNAAEAQAIVNYLKTL